MSDFLTTAFIRKLTIPFPDALTGITYQEVAELTEPEPENRLGKGAVENALRGISKSPRAITAGVYAVRLKRDLLNRFLYQFPQELGGEYAEEQEAEAHEYQP